jgi:hypothetical protein
VRQILALCPVPASNKQRKIIYHMARNAGFTVSGAIAIRDLSNRRASTKIKEELKKQGKLSYKANTFIDSILPYKERISNDAKGYFICDPLKCNYCERVGLSNCIGENIHVKR